MKCDKKKTAFLLLNTSNYRKVRLSRATHIFGDNFWFLLVYFGAKLAANNEHLRQTLQQSKKFRGTENIF